ncbi:MAG: PhzF family phenazine biosynthesis protein [Gemmatimonadota bacterium]|jgi:predicted PhzF superfamily epimerase YddE/YHI9
MAQAITQVDSFTAQPFRGNPAGVCVLEGERDAGWMQAVAKEMNLSETAFLRRRDDGDYDLRWFTPAVEVDLCGHATLASAHALWTEGHLAGEAPARFHTLSGLLTCQRVGDWIEMDFPAEPVLERLALPGESSRAGGAAPLALFEGLDISPDDVREVWRNRVDLLMVLREAAHVRGIRPNQTLLSTIDTRGIIVTAPSDSPDYDFVSRFFGPASGVPEDPVTGSAHCCLGPYWGQRLGRKEMVGYQASARGGVVRVRLEGERVTLAGQAVTVLRGTLED